LETRKIAQQNQSLQQVRDLDLDRVRRQAGMADTSAGSESRGREKSVIAAQASANSVCVEFVPDARKSVQLAAFPPSRRMHLAYRWSARNGCAVCNEPAIDLWDEIHISN
jgi:hypothetical protein